MSRALFCPSTDVSVFCCNVPYSANVRYETTNSTTDTTRVMPAMR